MKRFILPLVGFLALVALTGCEGMRFSQYSGEQRTWPTGGALADAVYDVPVYRGWPERPYEVLGFVQFSNPNTDWNRGDLKQAARQAQEAGGDAMLLISKGADPSPTVTTLRQQLELPANQTTGVVLKWKPLDPEPQL
jgi:hypothetical protein